MSTTTSCPQCARSLQITEAHLGKKVRCPTCSTVFVTPKVGAAAGPGGSGAARRGRDLPPWKFAVKVVEDPDRVLKGAYQVEVSAGGLTLSRKSVEVLRIPVGTRVESLGSGRFSADVGGRPVTLAVSQFNLYANRLAVDLVRFLSGETDALALADYKMPWFVSVAVLLPIGIGAVGMMGGAVGGGLGGAVAGGLIGANLVMVRKEKWPLAARVGACLAVDALAYLLLIAAVVAVAKHLPGNGPAAVPSRSVGPSVTLAGWGAVEDPDGDCRVAAEGGSATIEVPGTVHNLVLDSPGKTANAPRVMNPVDGDFVAEVQVVGEDRPADPPAPTSNISYHGAGLLLWGGAGDFIRLERAAFERNGVQSSVLMEHHAPGSAPSSQNFPLPTGSVFLRLERRGNRVSGSSSPDGARWQPLMSFDFLPGPARVGVAAVNTASAPFSVRFEGFRLGKP